MSITKKRAAEALFPLLSTFHEVSGLTLRTVRQELLDESMVRIVLEFDSKCLVIDADSDDDTVNLSVVEPSVSEALRGHDASQSTTWKRYLGRDFGWGWITINQQGYLDGLLLSFGGIMPQLMITVMASSLKLVDLTGEAAK